jgi:glycosyltransferase involved in cell wall biosynthesis
MSIIIPAFNEGGNIDCVLTQMCKAAELTLLPYEIIVVDDGSTDRTRELACGHKIVVLHNERNQGKGSALRRGLEYAQGDILITMDADGSHNPEDIRRLLIPILSGAHVTLGVRFVSEEGKASTTRVNLFGNSLINLLIWVLTRKRITDSQSGFRVLTRKALQEIRIFSTGYQIETELTVKSLRNGNVVKEVPLRVRKRANGRSHLNPLRDGLLILATILKSSVIN